jgi:REP element-mobilizing transposase RayT
LSAESAKSKTEGESFMTQSLSSILIHLIFSTKNREPFITEPIEKELHPYMARAFRELKSPTVTIGGTDDHVHVLFSLGRTVEVAELIEKVKTKSSKWIKTKGKEFKEFTGSEGMARFRLENHRSRL